jgi:hypothetical protein
MIKISIPVAKGNAAIKDGSLPRIVGSTLETLKPEAAYFLAENGKRTMLFVIDLKDPSDIPSIAEPFLMGLDAEISATPVMNQQDLQQGLTKLKL